jgi:hypothetical protein
MLDCHYFRPHKGIIYRCPLLKLNTDYVRGLAALLYPTQGVQLNTLTTKLKQGFAGPRLTRARVLQAECHGPTEGCNDLHE